MIKKQLIIILILIFSLNLFSQRIEINGQLRGVWISTVKRLDYPSQYGLNSDKLKAEFIKILDSCKAIGINAIFFQIRPSADAFYASKIEPWSEWLTGKQGRAPSPYFDPLEFMIIETHKRNMQFHAWINPFRAIATISKADIVDNHITKKRPDWFFDYGVNRYFDPGIPEVRKYIISIIADIVRRYDIDGIHFDDYFYPYPLKDQNNKIMDIPDNLTFKRFAWGYQDIRDWRRNNINLFIKQTNDTIKKIKPWLRFGVSPPGVWRNKGYDPDGSATLGLASYDWLYADVLTWLKNKWIDYVAPQLYWYIGHTRADYRILLDWWVKHTYGVDLYIGLNIDGIDATRQDKHWGNSNEIPQQIKLANSFPAVKGFVLFRYQSIAKNPLGIKDTLRNNYFRDTSTVVLIAKADKIENIELIKPDTTKTLIKTEIETIIPEIPEPTAPINVDKFRIENEISIIWDQNPYEQKIAYYNVYKFENNEEIIIDSNYLYLKSYKDFIRIERANNFAILGEKYFFIITAVNVNGIESEASKPVFVKIN